MKGKRKELSEMFCERVRLLLFRHRLTQTVFAERSGMSRATMSRLTRGHFLPSLETLCSIADQYQCSIDWLLGRVSENAEMQPEEVTQ